MNTKPFSAADLPVFPLVGGGHGMYHWQTPPDKLACHVIICGDPDRARAIATEFLDDAWTPPAHRGMQFVTGTTRAGNGLQGGRRVSVLGTGMGVGTTEICAVELLSTVGFDLSTRIPLPPEHRRQLTVIRVGTSGCLRPEFTLGRPIISDRLIGLDAAGIYYLEGAGSNPDADEERRLELVVRSAIHDAADRRWRHRATFPVYCNTTFPAVTNALHAAASELGLQVFRGHTVTADGFFAPQGRPVLRLDIAVPNLDAALAEADPCIANFEMEAAAANAILRPAGHRFGCICAAVAHRPTYRFATHEESAAGVRDSIVIALRALECLE